MDTPRLPRSYCPICGVGLRTVNGHHCKPAVYRGIDAANTRAWEPHPWASGEGRPYGDRLSDGMKMIEAEEDGEWAGMTNSPAT